MPESSSASISGSAPPSSQPTDSFESSSDGTYEYPFDPMLIVGSWEYVGDIVPTEGQPYYSFTFNDNGTLSYVQGWYQSDAGRTYVGTYYYADDVIGIILDYNPPAYPGYPDGMEAARHMETTIQLEPIGDMLSVTYVYGSPLYDGQPIGESLVFSKIANN